MKIFNVGNKSVNLYLLYSGTHCLLIDAGYPNQLNELGREIRKTGFKIRDIDYLVVTHFHIDHAGAIQELKNEGVEFILFDTQVNFIKPMEDMAIGKWRYTKLKLSDNIQLTTDASRDFLKQININGRVVNTPGHSDDSISLLLDSGEAFTGDLMPEHLITNETSLEKQSWIKLKNLTAKKVYPGHGSEYKIFC